MLEKKAFSSGVSKSGSSKGLVTIHTFSSSPLHFMFGDTNSSLGDPQLWESFLYFLLSGPFLFLTM